MDKEHPHTLAKLAALQARCDRLEKGIMMMAALAEAGRVISVKDICAIDKIIKGD